MSDYNYSHVHGFKTRIVGFIDDGIYPMKTRNENAGDECVIHHNLGFPAPRIPFFTFDS